MSVLQRIADFEIETLDAAVRLMLNTRKGTFSFMPHGATRPLKGSCSRDNPAQLGSPGNLGCCSNLRVA